MISYSNGRFIDSQDVSLPFLEDQLGTLRGFRFFSTCRTVNQKIFRLDDHVDRLFSMAEQVRMTLPHSRDELISILMDTLLRNRHLNQELMLIIFYSGGPADASGMAGSGPARCYVVVQPFNRPDASVYATGVALATYPFQRHFPTIKLFDYMGAVMAQHQVVVPQKAYGPLFLSVESEPKWLEGSTYNVFGVQNGTLITPDLDGRILSGITRRVVLELAASLGISCEERPVFSWETGLCSELFLTSSVRGVLPVTRVDQAVVGDGLIGPVSQRLMSAYTECLANF